MRRRVETSPNSRFVDIEAIQRAQNGSPDISSDSSDSDDSNDSSSVRSCIVVAEESGSE